MRPNSRVRISPCSAYPIPPELTDGMEVTLKAWRSGYVDVVDDAGREFHISGTCVDCGSLYRIYGEKEWLEESHPRVLAAIRAGVQELEETRHKWQPALVGDFEETLKDLRAVLARNNAL